jgi:hypothetical protein
MPVFAALVGVKVALYDPLEELHAAGSKVDLAGSKVIYRPLEQISFYIICRKTQENAKILQKWQNKTFWLGKKLNQLNVMLIAYLMSAVVHPPSPWKPAKKEEDFRRPITNALPISCRKALLYRKYECTYISSEI